MRFYNKVRFKITNFLQSSSNDQKLQMASSDQGIKTEFKLIWIHISIHRLLDYTCTCNHMGNMSKWIHSNYI